MGLNLSWFLGLLLDPILMIGDNWRIEWFVL